MIDCRGDVHKVGLTESTKRVVLSFYNVDIDGSLLALSTVRFV